MALAGVATEAPLRRQLRAPHADGARGHKAHALPSEEIGHRSCIR